MAGTGKERLRVAHAVGPGDVGKVAGDRLVGNRPGKRRRILWKARPQQQSRRSREHRPYSSCGRYKRRVTVSGEDFGPSKTKEGRRGGFPLLPSGLDLLF